MRLPKRQYKFLAAILIVVSLFGLYSFTSLFFTWNTQLEEVAINRVVDADTLFVEKDGELQKVRLLGINAPESVNPNRYANSEEGRQASKYVKELLEPCKFVYLEKDLFAEDKDKYGRLLRYVWLNKNTADSRNMLNLKLIKDGYAEYNSYGNEFLKYKKDFINAQQKEQ